MAALSYEAQILYDFLMPTADTADYKILFLKTAYEHVAEIERLVASFSSGQTTGVFKEIYRHAHSLKGSSSVMGFSQIAQRCSIIDDLITLDEHKDMPQDEKLTKIVKYVSEIKEELESIKHQS